MRPLSVVKAEVWSKIPHCVGRIAVNLQVHILVFDCSPQTFDEDIVQRTATAVHADQNILGFESAGERLAGELRSLIGVEDFRMALPQCAIQSRAAKSCIQTRRYFPTEHVAAEPIHDSNQINETRTEPDIRDVA